MSAPKVSILTASYHRNGISGEGFWAIIFDDAEQGRMVASLFDERGYCAVYKISELAATNIGFAQGNSWRGDVYEAVLRPALDDHQAQHGSNRLGCFAMPDGPKEAF